MEMHDLAPKIAKKNSGGDTHGPP